MRICHTYDRTSFWREDPRSFLDLVRKPIAKVFVHIFLHQMIECLEGDVKDFAPGAVIPGGGGRGPAKGIETLLDELKGNNGVLVILHLLATIPQSLPQQE